MQLLKHLFTSERIIYSVIILNAVGIFLISFPSLANNYVLHCIDHCFTVFFIFEAIVKISIFKRDYFRNNWNLFDFFIVLISLPSLFFINSGLSVFLLLRLLRLFRLVHLLKFIPNMSQMMMGLGRAFKASIFVLLALVLFLFILSILTCHLYGGVNAKLFGDPILSAYSIFQVFTVEGWQEIPAVLENGLSSSWLIGLTRLFFLLIVLFGGIFGLSIANAIFVDEMTIDNNEVLEKKVEELTQKIDRLQDLIEKFEKKC